MGAAVPVAIGQVVDNKFRIDRVLAQGGMGVLVAATHVLLQQRVAVKFRLGAKGDSTRFMREAQLAVRLHNPHVCRVMDLGMLAEDTPYIVMEYLDGNDLALEVERRGPLPVAEAVEYMLQACDAMSEAHALGIVHRDLKPENLFLARQNDGRSIVKVLDFGISKQQGITLTAEKDLMGTPAYMAHEQWASAKRVTAAADIYALGATLYYLLVGEPPFNASSIPEMFAMISTKSAPLLRERRADVPLELEVIVSSCLSRDITSRPADVLALSDALLPFAPERKRAALSIVGRAFADDARTPMASHRGLSTIDHLSVSAPSPQAERRPRRTIAIGVGFAAVAGLVVAVWLLASSRRDPPASDPHAVTPSSSHGVAVDAGPVDSPAVDAASPPVQPADAATPDASTPVRRPSVETRRTSVDAGAPIDASPPAQAPPDAPCATNDFKCKFGS